MTNAEASNFLSMNEQEQMFATTSECIAHGVISIYMSTRSCVQGKRPYSVEFDSCLQIGAETMVQKINKCENRDEKNYLSIELSLDNSKCIANGILYTYNSMRQCAATKDWYRKHGKVILLDCNPLVEEIIKTMIYKCMGMVSA